MGEEEVNYASVVFTRNSRLSSEAKKEEEIVYDEVKAKDDATSSTVEKKAERGGAHYQQLACCLGVLCVILLLLIIPVTIYYKMNQELKRQKEKVEDEKKSLTEELETIERSMDELITGLHQWGMKGINASCFREREKKCFACQNGWLLFRSNCYAINPEHCRKTWEEAQENCKNKNSSLAVVLNEEEKNFVHNSWDSTGINEYWVGLRVVDKKWKWIDGRDLTNNSWIRDNPISGYCAVSVQTNPRGFRSVWCSSHRNWICKQKALTLTLKKSGDKSYSHKDSYEHWVH
ncbi:asialoglycoprotein receptor 1-like [Pholidichthys leucotaenia]